MKFYKTIYNATKSGSLDTKLNYVSKDLKAYANDKSLFAGVCSATIASFIVYVLLLGTVVGGLMAFAIGNFYSKDLGYTFLFLTYLILTLMHVIRHLVLYAASQYASDLAKQNNAVVINA